MAFSPDGRYVLSGNESGHLCLSELATGRLIRTFEEHRGRVSLAVFSFSPDGSLIFSGLNHETLKLWDVKSGKEIRTFKAEP